MSAKDDKSIVVARAKNYVRVNLQAEGDAKRAAFSVKVEYKYTQAAHVFEFTVHLDFP